VLTNLSACIMAHCSIDVCERLLTAPADRRPGGGVKVCGQRARGDVCVHIPVCQVAPKCGSSAKGGIALDMAGSV